MSDIIKQFNVWKKKLDNAVNDSLENEVYNVAVEVMKEEIEEKVYKAYNSHASKPYVRRYDKGGLLDDKNIRKKIYKSKHSINIKNMTDNGKTVDVVESGKGYTWTASEIYKMQPFPRPFHKPAEEELINSGKAKRALIKGIKRNGFQ